MKEEMAEQPISAGKVIICIVDIVISLFATSYVLDTCSTRQEFVLFNTILPWLAFIAYLPARLFLGNSVLTRVIRTLLFLWFAFLAYSMPGCIDILAHELETPEAIPEMRRYLLPIPYLSLLLAFVCLIRGYPREKARARE